MTLSRRESSCVLPAECRSCKDPILWVEWPSGKKMPVDYKPDPSGSVVLTHRKAENKLLAAKFNAQQDKGRNRYACHFDTCSARGDG